MPAETSRRDLLITAAGLAGAAAGSGLTGRAARAEETKPAAAGDAAGSNHSAPNGELAFARPDGKSRVVSSGRINHSACMWCYKGMSVAEMAAVAERLGMPAIDLLTPADWAPLKEHGLVCSMTQGVWGGIAKGFNRTEHHDELVRSLTELADATAEAGYPNVVCFSGNRAGQADETGLKICAEGIKKVVGHFEKKKVTLCMELLNSKVSHKDYQCDLSRWGVDLCKAVGSERFRLLYDIYHMQVQEGDVIATIRKHHECFGHYHTGGVPGRAEIDDSQELYYPAIMKAIVETGFKGYVAQEFVPKRPDQIASLAQALMICDV